MGRGEARSGDRVECGERSDPLLAGAPIADSRPSRTCCACRETLRAASRFCSACGTECNLPLCLRCFAPLEPTDRFCFRCGETTIFDLSPAAVNKNARWSDERKIATILFADLAGFTALSSSLEPDQVWELANTCMNPLTREVEAHGGTVVKYIGDALMAVFGVPQSHPDDTRRAVEAGLAMARCIEEIRPEIRETFGDELSIRIGINTGLVMVGTVGDVTDRRLDVLGTAVNLASRIESAGSPGKVLVGPSTWRRVAGRFMGETGAPIELKGIPDPVPLTCISRRRSSEEEREATTWMLHAPSMRELELEAIQTSFELVAQQGLPRIVRLVADAGLGKELVLRRLWKALKHDLHRPMVLEATGRHWATAPVSPMLVLAGLLRSWHVVPPTADPEEARSTMIHRLEDQLGGMAPPMAPALLANLAGLHDVEHRFEEGASHSNLDEVVDGLAAWLRSLTHRRPVVLIVSDLQRADPASLDALPRLFERLLDVPLLGVFASDPRLDEMRPGYLEDLAFTERIDLLPLPENTMNALVHELLSTVDGVPEEARRSIVARTEGNPGFVREMVRMLHDQQVIVRDSVGRGTWDASRYRDDILPETVQGVIQTRLDALPADEKEVIKRAAVIGRTFWSGAVRALVPLAVRQQVPKVLGSLEAQRIIDRRESSQVPGDEEFIFKSNALRETALGSLPASARRSAHLGVATWLRAQGEVWEDGHLLLASHAIEGGRPEEARWPLIYAARRAAAIYANDSAVELYRRALDLWPAATELGQRVAVQRELCQGLVRQGEVEAALLVLETATSGCEALPKNESNRSLAWIAFERGVIFKDDGRSAEALTAIESALDCLSSFEDRVLHVRLLAEQGFLLLNAGNHDESEAALEAATRLLPPKGSRGSDAWRVASAHLANARGIFFRMQNAWDLATPLFEQAIDEGAGLGLSRVTLLARINLGAIAFLSKNFDEALDHFEDARVSARRAGDPALEAVARSNRGQALLELGRKPEARTELHAALELARTGHRRDVIAEAGACLAELLIEDGDVQGAEQQARESVTEAEAMAQPLYEMTAHEALCAALLALARRDASATSRDAARDALAAALAAADRLGAQAKDERTRLQQRFAELLSPGAASTKRPATPERAEP